MKTYRRGTKAARLMAFIAALAMTLNGCSGMDELGYQPAVADPETVRSQIGAYSESVQRLAALPGGKGGPDGALISTDARGVDRGYHMVDLWSIYGLSESELGEGYARIRAGLPSAGWRIVKEGESGYPKGTPEIRAEHEGDHATLRVEFLRQKPLLSVTVDSAIHIAPKDVDLNTVS